MNESKLYRQLFKASRDGLFVINTNGEYVAANAAAEEMTGYTEAELCTMTTDELVMPGEAVPTNEHRQMWEDGGAVEIQLRHKDGHSIPVELNISPISGVGEPLVLGIARDISHRKQTEMELRESEERFRQLAENINAIFYMTNLEKTEVLYISPAYEEIYGRSCQSLYETPSSFVDAIHPDDRPAVITTFKKQAHGEPIEVEFRVVRPDGSIRHVLSRSFPVFNKQGEAYRTAGIAQDITQLKKTEERLSSLAGRVQQITETTSDAAILTDWDGLILDVNPVCCQALGYTREEMLRKNIRTFEIALPPNDTAEHIQTLSEKGALRFETWHRHKNGTSIQFEVSATTIDTPVGKRIASFMRDITERKQSEAALQQFVEESAALAAISKSVSASLSLEEVVDRAVAETARAIHPDLVLLFLKEDEDLVLMGEYHPEGKPHHSETPVHRVGQCLCGMAAQSVESVFSTDIRADLRCTWAECKKAGMESFSALPLSVGGEVLGVLGLASAETRDFSKRATFFHALADTVATGIQNALLHRQILQHAAELEQRVTERTAELEERTIEMETVNQAMLVTLEDLQAANVRNEKMTAKLQRMNRELETFTHSVSHDLKAPLRGIDGYSRLLLEDYTDKLDDDGRKFLHTIRGATMQMNQLIEDLLAYSRLERRSKQREPLELHGLVVSVLHEFNDEIRVANIDVETNVPELNIATDPVGLEMAFRNLISNAIKFSKTNPNPTIKITGQQTENGCIIIVKDNGIGFDMKFHDRIFSIFQRLHRSEDYPGTGVGLAIVHKAMERLGGRAWAESALGQGATFFLEIPGESHGI